MKVMVIAKANDESENQKIPLDMEANAKMFEEMGKYNDELIAAGILLACDGLLPSRFGKRVHLSGTKRSVTDGPFAETKELLAGYWIWQVRSMEEAVEWAKRCPNTSGGDSVLELRPYFEMEEIGPELEAGVKAQQDKIANGRA